ncbi:MAG: glucose-6-phosphate isomerase, partial [Spirochaetota bacterium]|nr:glucose-6-phosphate isomerase [Spirochaetota bacterium]
MNSNFITLEYSNLLSILKEDEIFSLQSAVNKQHNALHNGSGMGNSFLGWIDLPERISKQEINEIKDTAKIISSEVDVLIVIGIGGSYLGAKAVIDALSNSFYNYLPKSELKAPQIIFAGHHLDSTYHYDLINYLKGKKFAINVISKSGTTTEPAIAFRLFKDILEKNVGKDQARKLIFATTDQSKGALKELSDNEGYKTFVIPDNVGGRYSVLTPVGLLPIAVAGIDIQELIDGAKSLQKLTETSNLHENVAYFYAAARNLLYQKGKKIEILINYTPSLQYVGEWWKQLFGESEGKNHKGIFPATCNFTTDLHSMGQWIQDGERSIFETVIHIEKSRHSLAIIKDEANLDQLNFLANHKMEYVNYQAILGTSIAHLDGGVPSMTLIIPE